MKMIENPTVTDKTGKIWTVEKLTAYATRNRNEIWSREVLNYVLLGAYTIEEILDIAKRGFRRNLLVHIGEPTRKYPQGRPYTPEIIVRELKKNGFDIKYDSAYRRLYMLKKFPKKGEKSLFAIPQYARVQDIPADYYEARSGLTPKRRQMTALLWAWNAGEIGQNEYIRRVDALEGV